MPRVSAAHEQEIRDRIVASAIRVFTDRGYGATIQDVVRESGLSVGAIYTYFKSKEELFLECCEVMTSGSLETLGAMLAGKATTAERLATATAFYLDSIDEAPEGGPGLVTLVQAWAVAESEPRIRANVTNTRLVALSMSSTPMNTTMALRRSSTVAPPIAKRTAAK